MHRYTLVATAAALATFALTAPARALGDVTPEPLAHEELRAAEPGEGAELTEAPAAIRLTFVNPVRIPSAHVSLTGPDGAVELGELRRSADAANVLVALIEGSLVAGRYTVRWRVAGPDGHPVGGEYTFTILADAAGLAPPAEPEADARDAGGAAEPDAPQAEPFPLSSDFDAQSPLYVGIRWLTFLGLLGTIGTVAFRVLVLSMVRRSKDSAGEGLIAAATQRAVAVGTGAAVLLAVALAVRLYAQSFALHGPHRALDPSILPGLLTGTAWSLGWWLQALGTAMALVGFLLARRRRAGAWGVATAGAAILAFSPAFAGHAAAVAGLAPLAILADGLHVLGAAGWLGSLLVVVVAGVPAALDRSEGRGAAVASLIHAFSPTALFFAGVVVATGIVSAWLHLETVPALWTSGYGRTLLLKVGVLSLLFATGAYNWLRVKPSLGAPEAASRLRRSAVLELAVGVIVLAVTAVLVATPPP